MNITKSIVGNMIRHQDELDQLREENRQLRKLVKRLKKENDALRARAGEPPTSASLH